MVVIEHHEQAAVGERLDALGAGDRDRKASRRLALGIGGAWIAHLTALEPLRPWFIAATLLFLGLAFRRLYLQPQVCEPGTACAEPIVLQRQRLTFWVVALALLALLSVPWLAPLSL